MSDWREKEARNQALFREVNERTEQVGESFGSDGQGSFICECGNPECTQALEVAHDEYEHVRTHAFRCLPQPICGREARTAAACFHRLDSIQASRRWCRASA